MSKRERFEVRRISTIEELEALPAGCVLLDNRCFFWETYDGPETDEVPDLPVLVYAFPWDHEAQAEYRALLADAGIE